MENTGKFNKHTDFSKVEPYPIKELTPEESAKMRETHKFVPISLFDLFDQELMASVHFDKEEFDAFLDEYGDNDEVIDLLMKEDKTFSEAKQLVVILNKFRK